MPKIWDGGCGFEKQMSLSVFTEGVKVPERLHDIYNVHLNPLLIPISVNPLVSGWSMKGTICDILPYCCILLLRQESSRCTLFGGIIGPSRS